MKMENLEEFEKKREKKDRSNQTSMQDLDNDAAENAKKHNIHYSNILENYAATAKVNLNNNLLFKKCYFWGSVAVLGILVIALVLTLIFADPHDSESVYLTVLVSFLTAYIVLPITITKYLFNPKETIQLNKIVRSIQEHDRIMTGHIDSKDEDISNG